MDDTLEIYCDESGYTGPDLLQDQQPHFSYAGVAVSLEEARDLIARIRRDHLIANPELKATDLIRTETGLHAILDVLKAVEGRFVFVFFHKRLGLCGKVFEYLYEPVFQHAPKLLYERNLHRFVAMFGLILHQGGDPFTTEALRQFQIFMRSRDIGQAPILFGDDALSQESPYAMVTRFAHSYRALIEADRYAAARAQDPALDLGVSGLWSILTKFGELERPLAVTCDNSPLTQSVAARLSGGPQDVGILRVRSLLRSAEISEYELVHPVRFADSKGNAGLQIADLIAGLATATVNGKLPPAAFEEIAERLDAGCHHRHSVSPEQQWVNLSERGPMINNMMLMELAMRADQGADPTRGLERQYREFERAWDSGDLADISGD